MLTFQISEIIDFIRLKPCGSIIPPSLIETLEHAFFKYLTAREFDIAFAYAILQQQKHKLSKRQ